MAGTSLRSTLACSAASTLRNLADIVYNSDFLSIPSNTNVAISYFFVTPRTDSVTGCCTEVTSPTYVVTYDDLIYGIQNPQSGTGTLMDPYIITANKFQNMLSNIGATVDNLIQTL
jgi:hypothetical protein